MIALKEYNEYKKQSLKILEKNHVFISKDESDKFELADFGFNKIQTFGIQTFLLIKTNKLCLKLMILFPYQICPEHKHSIIKNGKEEGKEENIRIINGNIFFYKEGLNCNKPKAKIPFEKKDYFTVFNEIILKKGMKTTIEPDIWHWFQAGPNGVIIENISTKTVDEEDLFRDPEIIRMPKII